MMGGSGAHEYMAPCPAGENEVALAPGYAANVEVASAEPQPVELPPALDAPEPVATPGLTTVEEVAGALGVAAGRAAEGDAGGRRGARDSCWSLVRGDHRLNEIKLRNALGADFRPARRGGDRRSSWGRPASSARSAPRCRSSRTRRSTATPSSPAPTRPTPTCAACEPGRDFAFEEVDVRTVEAGDTAPGGGTIEIEPAIEVGNIFKLGTRYSEPLGATYLDESGSEQPIVMGSYGIGPARIVAAAIEQGADEKRDRLAARRSRPGRSTSSRSRRPASPSARPRTASTRSCGRRASRSSTTTATPDRGRS